MDLSMLKPGERGRIKDIRVVGSLKRRLMDMGILGNCRTKDRCGI